MENRPQKAAVFILLGQSNAVGHGIPMAEEDKILTPMKNVFGLHRDHNQSFENKTLTWSGYTSGGMNLAEEQDHTYSVANCLAAAWQKRIDGGENLPDLYIIQIAIGGQGVTRRFMWHPTRPSREIIPGRLGKVKISLFPFAMHIFSLLEESFRQMGKEYQIMGLHWRGGEEDTMEEEDYLRQNLMPLYTQILDAFHQALHTPTVWLHRLICKDCLNEEDPTGREERNMHYVNEVFAELERMYPNVRIFDIRNAPQYIPDVRCNGVFIKDAVHYTPEVNRWVADWVIEDYLSK